MVIIDKTYAFSIKNAPKWHGKDYCYNKIGKSNLIFIKKYLFFALCYKKKTYLCRLYRRFITYNEIRGNFKVD